jgi:copper chaperone CopZ
MISLSRAALLSLLFSALLLSPAEAKPVKHQITGLFMPEREQDLREVAAKIPGVKLVSIDFRNAEATFDYEVKQFGTPDQAIQRLDALLRDASQHTFGVKPLCRSPADKLKFVDIPVAGLDCKACCLAAYEAIYRLDGVERATASFRDGRVTAYIDPARTDRGKLVAALKAREVQVKAP